jgi:hypothetical protein
VVLTARYSDNTVRVWVGRDDVLAGVVRAIADGRAA